MSRPKWDVLWSPFHSDRFITWDSDALLNLYEIGPRDNSVRETDQTCKATISLYRAHVCFEMVIIHVVSFSMQICRYRNTLSPNWFVPLPSTAMRNASTYIRSQSQISLPVVTRMER